MIDKNTEKSWQKVRRMGEEYQKFLHQRVALLECEIAEIPAPAPDPESRAQFSTAAPTEGWRKIAPGEKWGGNFAYGWFRTSYTVPEELAGQALFLRSLTGEQDGLLFLNGKPAGLFDASPSHEHGWDRLHIVQPLSLSAKAGETYDILLEGYAGHALYGVHPKENYYWEDGAIRTYQGMEVVTCDELVGDFLLSVDLLFQLVDTSRHDSRQYHDAVNAAVEIFKLLPQFPGDELPRAEVEQAVAIIHAVTEKGVSTDEYGTAGLVGHSHLDTAWQWPVRETVHKAARTFSNALRLMEVYPDYHFVQSSAVYLMWMKEYYPTIFEEIKKRVAEGRWEPIGSAWVECDNNMTGGEYIIRQFLRGQRFVEENMKYISDCFWQPDTFGYTAALPQILRGCGIKYFLTTKLSWNEANHFPHDSFVWRGIDGSEVITHFNITHVHPTARDIRDSMSKIEHRDVTDMKLIAYGFGDGGGGPSYSMQEELEHIRKLPEMPKIKETRVTDFMHELEATAKNLPVFAGELYLELHRGTLTQMSDIKRSNRLLEKAIRNAEILGVIADNPDRAPIATALDTLLTNQFHDILPGTCIEDAHRVAIHQNYTQAEKLDGYTAGLLTDGGDDGVTVYNSLSWDRAGQVTVADPGKDPDGCAVQRYTAADGSAKLVFRAETPAMSVAHLPYGTAADAACPFTVDGEVITTPFATVCLTKDGTITSYKTKNGTEVVRPGGEPLNTLYAGEDVPLIWDNWDVDYDQHYKMKPVTGATRCEVVSIGALQLRVRVEKPFGAASVLRQDIVFYADTPRIDFETVIDWKEKHTLLKAGFDVDVLADTARFETQYGHIKRPTHENYGPDKSQFEVCNHKWTDLSDNRFGVAVLNDCKYGISVSGSDMRLTLHKGGCRPDPRGDEGVHCVTYSLLVHESGFNTAQVIRPAYELNYPVIAHAGAAAVKSGSLFTLSGDDNVILETVKYAEDGDGIVLRLYETEGSHANCRVAGVRTAVETDMLERAKGALTVEDGAVALSLRPFEIKTVKVTR